MTQTDAAHLSRFEMNDERKERKGALRGWRERDEDRRCSERGIGREKDRRFFGQRGLPVAFGFPLAPVNLLLLFFPLFFFHYAKLSTARISLSFPPCLPPPSTILSLPPFVPSLPSFSRYFSLIFSPLVLSSFSLSFDFSLDFFENAAPIHHRRATIIMQSVLALKNRSRSIRRRRSPGTHRSRFSRSTIEFLRESNTRPIVTDFLTEFLFFHQNRTIILLESRLSGGNKNGVRVRSSSDRFGDRKENRGNRLLVLVVSRTRERIAKKTNKILTISDKLRNFFSL